MMPDIPDATEPSGDPGFDDPRDMLLACHEKVAHFSRLTLRLQAHLASNGADHDAIEAANRILRYFRIAAPLHHDDEERDLFPALLGLKEEGLDPASTAALYADIAQLECEHLQLDQMWSEISPWLDSVASGQTLMPPVDLTAFVDLYHAHMQCEQNRVFPLTSRLSATRRKQVCQHMARRRGLTI